jgi:hypothetical protein
MPAAHQQPHGDGGRVPTARHEPDAGVEGQLRPRSAHTARISAGSPMISAMGATNGFR